MNCPECGTILNVVLKTRQYEDTTVRRRECFNEHRFTTVEHVAKLVHGRRRNVGKKKGRKWPQEVRDQAETMRAARMPVALISQRLGVPDNTLIEWFRKPKEHKNVKPNT